MEIPTAHSDIGNDWITRWEKVDEFEKIFPIIIVLSMKCLSVVEQPLSALS